MGQIDKRFEHRQPGQLKAPKTFVDLLALEGKRLRLSDLTGERYLESEEGPGVFNLYALDEDKGHWFLLVDSLNEVQLLCVLTSMIYAAEMAKVTP